MLFSRLRGDNRSSASEAGTERLPIFFSEMRALHEMVVLIQQQSTEQPETQHRKRRGTSYNTLMSRSGKDGLLQQVSLNYLDLAQNHRKPIKDESISIPKTNIKATNLSRSCNILNHIDV